MYIQYVNVCIIYIYNTHTYIEYKIRSKYTKIHTIKLCLYNLYKYVCDIDKNKILYSNLFAC